MRSMTIAGKLFVVFLAASASLTVLAVGQEPVVTDFSRDIQPILANHCFSCHGPDEVTREADLRLDDRESALASAAIVPEDLEHSKLIERILSLDPDSQMPPPTHKRPLSVEQQEKLQAWISQGAKYAAHWAFEPPARAVFERVPAEHEPGSTAVADPIDYFVRQQLSEVQLAPSPPADRRTLIRRVTLDLTGLPPTPQAVEDFVSDTTPNAYEKVVDRLLATKNYAERMTMEWLDLARYADTNGYNNDEDRTMWPWRDWVIDAFHNNLPFDQFVVEQLAGDLIPSPSQSQLIATAFLRNQGHNTEGGIIQEEYRVEYVADRVHTTATVFLGLSLQCARCHDHKYDPVSQKEYYQFYAYFNSLDEKQASYSKFLAAEPFVRVPSADQETRLQELQQALANQRQLLDSRRLDVDQRLAEWQVERLADKEGAEKTTLYTHKLLNHFSMEPQSEPLPEPSPVSTGEQFLHDSATGTASGHAVGQVEIEAGHVGSGLAFDGTAHVDLGQIAALDREQAFAIGAWIYPTSSETMAIFSKMDDASQHLGYDLLLENGKLVSHLVHRWPDNAIKVATQQPLSLNAWHHVVLVYSGGSQAAGVKIYVDNQLMPLDTLSDSLTASFATPKPFHLGLRGTSLPFRGKIDELMIVQGTLFTEQIEQWFAGQPIESFEKLLAISASERTEEQTRQLHDFFLTHVDEESIRLRKAIAGVESELQTLQDSFSAVSVMRDMQTPRETFVLQRGQYDQPQDKVTAAVPTLFVSAVDAQANNRLGLAKWLVDPDHPLTARVAVNRWWQHYFGTGLVKTVEDFGITGDRPSHPELLDYLALSFIDSGWDVKSLQKKIVLSATYQQESRISPEGLERDPENRWLSRGPRFRLPAETVRDNALAISGLLQSRVGGPSVKPYQPEGLWEDVSVERRAKYVPDVGEGLHRRSMYSFWKRTCPPPAMMNFDAPNREVCFARRPRTNTPLQSLVLMNDPTYIEAARMLAQQMLVAEVSTTAERIQVGYRRCLAREATDAELTVMQELLDQARQQFRQQSEAAQALNAIGAIRAEEGLDAVEVAAWTMLGSTLLNLDETVSKR